MAKIQIKNSFITSSAQITISSSLVRFSDSIRAKGITGSFSGSFAGSNLFVQGGNSFGTTALLGTNDNQPLVLETNASEKLRIISDGNVGIGTSSPLSKLHILGSNGGTDYVYQRWSYTANVGVYDLILKQTVTSGVVRYNFSMNNASTAYNDVLVLDRGCVGIGTSFPLSKLDVRGTMYVNYGSNGTGYIQTNGTDSDLQITTATNLTSLLNTGTSGAMAFGAGNSERMRILSNGNIGIGTTSPTQKLEVAGYAMAGESSYRTSIYGNSGGAWIGFGDTSNTVSLGRIGAYGSLFNINSLNGATSFQYDGSEKMRITTGGNVGIGTSSPNANLHVSGTFQVGNGTNFGNKFTVYDNLSSGKISFALRDTNGDDIFSLYGNSTTGEARLIADDDNGTAFMTFQMNASERMRIQNDGNVGIGSTTPAYKLDVNGSIAVSGYRFADFNTYYNRIFEPAGNTAIWLGNASDPTNYYDNTNHAFRNRGGSSVYAYINSNGNLGIGTTSVSSKLQIGNGTNNTYSSVAQLSGDSGGASTLIALSLVNSRGAVTGNGVGIDFHNAGNYSATGRISVVQAGALTTDSEMRFFVYNDNITQRMVLNYLGNLGIGTTNPVAKLHITGSSTAAVFQGNVGIGTTSFTYSTSNRGLLELYGATDSLIALRNSNNPFYIQKYSTATYFNNTDNGPLIIYTNNTERMRLAADGNVGIGTTNPVNKLDVRGNVGIGVGAGSIPAYVFEGVCPSAVNHNLNIYGQSSGTNDQVTFTLNRGGGAYGLFSVNFLTVNRFSVAGGSLQDSGNIILNPVSNVYIQSGNLGVGTASPTAKLDVAGNTKFGSSLSNTHQFTGSVNFGGSTYNNSIAIDKFEYFSLQPYIEGGSFPSNVFSLSGTFPTFVTMTGSACPFGKVAYNVSYYEAIGDFIPVQAGETLYGEIWAYRSSGATGTAGVFYCGIARYDKNKNPIDSNAGLNYFIVTAATVPSNSTWTKYSNTTTLPLTHTPYNGSDGGPVRYIRPYIIVNYTAGTVPTYWGAFKIRKQQLTRDNGTIFISGSVGIGVSTPAYPLHVRTSANTGTIAIGNVTYPGLISTNAGSGEFRIDNRTSAAAGYITFYPNGEAGSAGSEAMRIITNGNVGIGTSSPAAKLDVVGSLIAGGVNNGSVIFYRNTNPGTIGNTDAVLYVSDRSNSDWGIIVDKTGWDYALRLNVANSSTNAFGIYDGSTYNTLLYGNGGGYFLGDISIGTSSTPSARLRLASSNNSRVLWFTGATTGYTYGQIDNSGGAYYIGMSDNIGQFWGSTPYAGYHATLGTSANIPLTFATNNLIRVLLDNNGNLGIGTTAPATKLDVNGVLSFNGVTVLNQVNDANDIYANIRVIRNRSSTLNDGMYINYDSTGTTAAHLRFYANAQNERMRIQANDGHVGIGTSIAAGRLDVYDSTDAGNIAFVRNASTGTSAYSAIVLRRNGDANGIVLFTNSSNRTTDGGAGNSTIRTDNGNLLLGAGGSSQHILTTAGSVGIGTTSPGSKLDVNGTFRTAINNLTIFNDYLYVSPTENNTLNSAYFANSIADMWINYRGYNNGNTQFRNFNVGNGKAENIAWFDGTNKRLSINNGQTANYTLDVNGTFNATGTSTLAAVSITGTINSSATEAVRINNNNAFISFYNSAGNSRTGYLQGNSGNDILLASENGAVIRFAIGGSEVARISTSGNVGIGTTKPTGSLHVYQAVGTGETITATIQEGAGGAAELVFRAGNASTNRRGALRFYNNQVSSTTAQWTVGASMSQTSGDNSFYFYNNGSTSVLTLSQTNVGIGSTAPAYKLDVNGTFRSTGDLWTNGNIIINRAGAYLYINGTNSDSEIVWQANGSNRWAAGMNVGDATENFNVYNYTTATTNFTILKANGNVGIGSTAPNDKLDVVGRVYAYRYIAVSSNASLPAYATDTSTGMFNAATNQIGFSISGTEKVRIDTNGNVGIGTTSPAQKLHVVGAVYGTTYGQFGTSVASGTNSSYAVFGSNSAVVGVKINIDSNVNRNDLVVSGSTGNVGIGTSQVLSKLNAYASGSNLSVFRVDGGNGTLFEVTDQLSGSLFSVNDVSGLPLLEVFSNNRVVAGKYGTNALVVSGSSVGIGTSRPSYRLQVSGSFAATTKSFVIKHPDPAKSDKQLVHGVTEGPEHSVFVRGKLENNNIIQLPDYWQHLVDVDTISVTLTPNKYYQQLYVKNVTDKSIEVGTATDKPINCYYYVVGERKDIPKLITEI